MKSDFSLFPLHFLSVTIKLGCQPEISNFGQHLFQVPPVQRSEVVMTAVDDSAGNWIALVLHGQFYSLFFDKTREGECFRFQRLLEYFRASSLKSTIISVFSLSKAGKEANDLPV